MLTIGLTGGIGAGKSTVAKLLAARGAEVINADFVGHDVYRPGTEGWRQVVDAFGHEIVAPTVRSTANGWAPSCSRIRRR